MESLCDIRRTCLVRRAWTILSVLLLSSAGYLDSLSSAQSVCGEPQTTPIPVEDPAGVDALRAALDCATGGEVEAEWVGPVTVAAPIVVGEGTFLSVTGGDDLAEVHGGASQTNGTRLFEVSPGGRLTLTGLKLSGGSARDGGAVYSVLANLTLTNCLFDGNVATAGSGGAIWADRGAVTIVGGEFLRNNATRYGGAVSASSGSLEVRGGSRFVGNTAMIAGGGLFCGLNSVSPDKAFAVCSITDAEFVFNSAAREDQGSIDGFSYLDGGGAAMFQFAEVYIADSAFGWNHARLSGGALHGGANTNVSVSGCKFGNNTSEKYGGAISASSMTLGGGTELTNNSAPTAGGAVLGWDANGAIIFQDVVCKENTAEENGGCFYGTGTGLFSNGTTLLNNLANNGASIYAEKGGNVSVSGGTYTGRSKSRGGFLYAADATRVHITGGVMAGNFAGKKGGALYVNGEEASDILIEGGTFKNNKALESGGAVAVWGAPGLVTITGGTFENNRAIFYGGFAFLEIEASMSCMGATVSGNYAGDQGGGIYAREATWVNSSCDLISNEAPQGAAIYLTNVKSATFENHDVADNLASGGSVVYVAASTVVAREVMFASSVGLQDYSFNRAVQLDGNTTLDAEKCVFDGWLGDAVVLNLNPTNGSLVLDSCDFRKSSAVLAVVSPNSDAEIRNAVVSSLTFKNAVAGTVKNPLTLVDRALACNHPNVCGSGECVNSTLGVLCECLEGGECLHDGGELSLSLEKRPATETFSPDPVEFQFMVSAESVGTTDVIWKLVFEGDDLDLDVVPSSGLLPPGGSVIVSVTGTSMKQDVGGNLSSRFTLMSVGNTSSGSTVVDSMNVTSAFYLCQAYEYAKPLEDEDSADGFTCAQCATIINQEGVDCQYPGATKALLPVKDGFWRSSQETLEVHQCLHSAACVGATEVSGSDDYCADGYKGPYCAVCKEEYGRGVSNSCHYCDDTTAHVLFAMGTLFSLVVILLLLLAAVFLIGGLDAIDIVRQTVSRKIPFGSNSSAGGVSVPKTSLRGKSESLASANPFDSAIAPAFALESGTQHGGGNGGIAPGKVFPTNYSEDPDDSGRTYARPLGAVVEIELSDTSGNCAARKEGMSVGRHARFSADTAGGVGGVQANRRTDSEAAGEIEKPMCCGFGDKVKRWLSRLPFDKLKILVVVWQILTVFSGITGVEFPATYSRFLTWINVVNLDIGNIFSASCILPSANFYARLLLTTLTPLVLAAVLVVTYKMAKRRAGIGRAGVIARRAAWSRHVAAGLLLTFLVFTSASTAAFKILACDPDVVDGESYLRADYSISCKSGMYTFFQVYAVLMIVVYPIGIPVLYATILWKNRELLNPRLHAQPGGSGDAASGDSASGDDDPFDTTVTTSKGQTKNAYSSEELQELEEKVQARRVHPELVPSMFLWKDFGPDLYYYEVIECGRRMLLTGVLIFISPHTATQAAMACIFAFASLLGFELMRPHMDPTDSWLYRLGCVVIFLSNFLALLIKVDAGGEENRAAFGFLLVVINVMLVLAVLLTSWFATQQSVDDSREDETSFAIAKTMLTAEQFAADSARLTRGGGGARTSAAPSVRPDLPRSDRGEVWRGSATSRVMHGSTATVATSEDALPSLSRRGSVNAANLERLQHQNEGRGHSGADRFSHGSQSFSPVLL